MKFQPVIALVELVKLVVWSFIKTFLNVYFSENKQLREFTIRIDDNNIKKYNKIKR